MEALKAPRQGNFSPPRYHETAPSVLLGSGVLGRDDPDRVLDALFLFGEA